MKVYAQKQSKPQQRSSHDIKRSSAQPLAASHMIHPILYLQRTIGNQAVQRLLQAHVNNGLLPSSGNPVAKTSTGGTTLLQRQPPKIDFPPLEEEKIRIPERSVSYETATSRVLSWGKDTCCSNLGFPDPAKNKKAGAKCCNTFPRFVDKEATNLGFDGAASCRPDRKGRTATVTRRDNSKSVTVVCTDTRKFSKDPLVINTIELGFKAAAKYGRAPLDEVGEVSYGDRVTGTCSHVTICKETVNPKESQCLSPDCSK